MNKQLWEVQSTDLLLFSLLWNSCVVHLFIQTYQPLSKKHSQCLQACFLCPDLFERRYLRCRSSNICCIHSVFPQQIICGQGDFFFSFYNLVAFWRNVNTDRTCHLKQANSYLYNIKNLTAWGPPYLVFKGFNFACWQQNMVQHCVPAAQQGSQSQVLLSAVLLTIFFFTPPILQFFLSLPRWPASSSLVPL